MNQIQVQYLPYKIGRVCQHDLSKANSNYIDIVCTRKSQTYHRVSQASKICNKCATLIMNSVNNTQECPCCSQKLQQLLSNSWICNHQSRNLDEIIIKCLNNEKETHEVPFRQKVCKSCYDKIRASFMFASSCVVCDEKQNQLLENIEKTITQPSYYFFNQVINKIKDKKLSQQDIKNQIECFCLAQPHNDDYKSKFDSQSQMFGQNQMDQHQSKRYQLYPKCQKHRNSHINLCNNCLVSILNLKCCPYGCSYQKKQNKTAKSGGSYTSQTGFLCLYPKRNKDYQYLQHFVLRYKEQVNKMDKWEGSLKKIKYSNNENLQNKFALYSAAIQISKYSYFYCGGALGTNISNMKSTNSCFVININQNLKSFTIQDLPPMNEARSSHGIVYFNNYIFVAGGFYKQGMKCLSSCQKFNLKTKKWEKMANLKIQRSKPNLMEFQGKLYVLGGISNNQYIWTCHCQRYDIEKDEWQGINYKGYDIPYITGATPLNKCWAVGQTKNMYLVGGSNYQASTYFFQDIDFSNNDFSLNQIGNQQRLIYNRESAALSLMNTDKQHQKIVVVFGGVEQNISLLSFDAIRIKYKQKQVTPFFVYDEIGIGSYRLLLRQNAQSAYIYMKNKLSEQGLLTGEKLQDKKQKKQQGQNQGKQKSLTENEEQLYWLEKMWYGIGKCIVGFSGL